MFCFNFVEMQYCPLTEARNGLHHSRGWIADSPQLTGPIGSTDLALKRQLGFILRVFIPIALGMQAKCAVSKTFHSPAPACFASSSLDSPHYTLPSSCPEPLPGPGLCCSLLCAQPVHLSMVMLPKHGTCVFPSAFVISSFVFFYSFPLFFFPFRELSQTFKSTLGAPTMCCHILLCLP